MKYAYYTYELMSGLYIKYNRLTRIYFIDKPLILYRYIQGIYTSYALESIDVCIIYMRVIHKIQWVYT